MTLFLTGSFAAQAGPPSAPNEAVEATPCAPRPAAWFRCEQKPEPLVPVLFHTTLRPARRWRCEGGDGSTGFSFKARLAVADERPRRLVAERA